MMNTTEKLSTTRTPVVTAQSEIVFGGASNSYYADPRARLVFGYIETNVHGEHVAHVAIARSIDYAENPVAELLIRHHIASSPVVTSKSLAIGWVEAAVVWCVEHFRQYDDAGRLPLPREGHSHCSSCGHFDTLKTQQLAYGDLTTCTTDSCDFESYYSIGD
jgi:hypothetical protein